MSKSFVHSELKNILHEIIDYFVSHKELCVKDPERHFIRIRNLTLKDILILILSMGTGSMDMELEDFCFCHEKAMSDSALIQQKAKLLEDVFRRIFELFNKKSKKYDHETYRGYKIYAAHGSVMDVAGNENDPTYVPSNSKTKAGIEIPGKNQIHMDALFDVLNQVYIDAEITPKPQADERTGLITMLKRTLFETKTIILCDRGYPAWNLFVHFKYTKNVDYLIRCVNDRYAFLRELPMEKLDVDYAFTLTTNKNESEKLGYIYVQTRKHRKSTPYKNPEKGSEVNWDFGEHEELELRVVRFQLNSGEYETIITSLSREEFSVEEIKKLYALLWGIETSFHFLKNVIMGKKPKSRRADFILQEIFARLTYFNFCNRIINQTKPHDSDTSKYKKRINFTKAVIYCRLFFRGWMNVRVFYSKLQRHTVPIRPNRPDTRKNKKACYNATDQPT